MIEQSGSVNLEKRKREREIRDERKVRENEDKE